MCVEVPSETEAVQGTDMKLLCISCMKREEVTASTVVEWFYRPEGGKDEPVCMSGNRALSISFLAYPISTPGHSPNSWQEKLESVLEFKHLGCRFSNANFQSHSFSASSPVCKDVRYH